MEDHRNRGTGSRSPDVRKRDGEKYGEERAGGGGEGGAPGGETQRRDIYGRLLNLWRLEEYLLHAYHSIFLTANSVLFAIATLLIFRMGTVTAAGGAQNAGQPQAPQSLVLAIIVVGTTTCLAYLLVLLDRAHAANFPAEAMEDLDNDPCGADRYENTYSAFAGYRREGGGLRFLRRKAFWALLIRSKPRVILALVPIALTVLWVWLAVYAF